MIFGARRFALRHKFCWRYPKLQHCALLTHQRREGRHHHSPHAQCLFFAVFTSAGEDKDILESTDPDAVIDMRRRGIEYSMDSDRPGMLIRKKLMELLARHGEAEAHR